jgi:hypothetical protein
MSHQIIKDHSSGGMSYNNMRASFYAKKFNSPSLSSYMLDKHAYVFDSVIPWYVPGDMVSIYRPFGERNIAHWNVGKPTTKEYIHVVVSAEKIHSRSEKFVPYESLPPEQRAKLQKRTVTYEMLSSSPAPGMIASVSSIGRNDDIHLVDEFDYMFCFFCPEDNIMLYKNQFVTHFFVDDAERERYELL